MNGRLLACLLTVTALTAAPSFGATCRYWPIECGQWDTDRLENAICHFSDTGRPFFGYSYFAVSGTVLDVFLSSDAFKPQLALYRGRTNSTPIAFGTSGTTITQLKYDVVFSDMYYIVASSDRSSGSTGPWRLDFFCSVICRAPFPLVTAPFKTSIGYGQSTMIEEKADGTPSIVYEWFDDSTPPAPVGVGPLLITSPLLRTTRFHVRVSNGCGSYDDYSIVEVAAAPAPPTRRRTARH